LLSWEKLRAWCATLEREREREVDECKVQSISKAGVEFTVV